MANERGSAQTLEEDWSWSLSLQGVERHSSLIQVRHRVRNLDSSRKSLERATQEGDSPVGESVEALVMSLSTAGHVESRGNLGGPSSKAKYSLATDSEPVP